MVCLGVVFGWWCFTSFHIRFITVKDHHLRMIFGPYFQPATICKSQVLVGAGVGGHCTQPTGILRTGGLTRTPSRLFGSSWFFFGGELPFLMVFSLTSRGVGRRGLLWTNWCFWEGHRQNFFFMRARNLAVLNESMWVHPRKITCLPLYEGAFSASMLVVQGVYRSKCFQDPQNPAKGFPILFSCRFYQVLAGPDFDTNISYPGDDSTIPYHPWELYIYQPPWDPISIRLALLNPSCIGKYTFSMDGIGMEWYNSSWKTHPLELEDFSSIVLFLP